ncbi:MAG: hypothetical protein MK102_06380 [Fuerstiella sp.]|nr:hypothetical protein [Fuerstiella sp.]
MAVSVLQIGVYFDFVARLKYSDTDLIESGDVILLRWTFSEEFGNILMSLFRVMFFVGSDGRSWSALEDQTIGMESRLRVESAVFGTSKD